MSTPKYQIIINDIINAIDSKELQPGTYLPSENEISLKYNVSRMTVNKALNYLSHEGYINKKKGIGSFVTYRKVVKTFSEPRSFTEDMFLIGETPAAQLVEYKVVKAKDYPVVKDALHLEDNDLIHYFVRVRTANGVKVLLSYTFISVGMVPTINVKELSNSLYEFLKMEYRISPLSSDYTVNAIISSHTENELLDIHNKALMQVSHISYLESGIPFMYSDNFYLGERFSFKSNQSYLRNVVTSQKQIER